MRKIRELVVDISTELTSLQKSAKPTVDVSDVFPVHTLPMGDGQSIVISRKIEQLIHVVGKQFQANDAALAANFGRNELHAGMRRAFGAALAEIDLDDDPTRNAETVLVRVREIVAKQVQDTTQLREHCFGCTLFGNSNIKSFEIGAVQFEQRSNWLTRKVVAGDITRTTQRRIEKIWQGGKLAKRKNTRERIREQNILMAIGDCNFVCSVVTTGAALEIGQEKALVAARIAMSSIALLWATPSRAPDGFNLIFDRKLHHQIALSFESGKRSQFGSRLSHLPEGPTLKTGEWETLFSQRRTHFDVIAEAIDYYLNPVKPALRPRMMSVCLHALLWFHEGCKERLPLLAVVKFAASMDALACGGKERGITELIRIRLGIDGAGKLFADGTTTKEALSEIYGYVRSRTIHGSNDKLGYDWSETRARAEQMARLCLLACIDWVGRNESSVDPRSLAK